ncbi:LysR family transcriptional regulator [Ruficoccus amylovorans]|uniref:LysR family transcriptional regulator n=1 Tax=Ruficoccus amylovorans TaxID=1804625 RepID=A0A842HFZ9_9BACT|nr:LysR family transcriptional regulator [Ruficoccus amylovorans]MBC2594464.1 LysR family transcriptional regulator [Ruficoccus amylovorans]
MELRHLECLVEVVRQGGFSAAARTLGMTQPTVSKAVGQLEHECGARLLDRLKEGVRVTDAGACVLRRAKMMLTERDHLNDELAELRGLESGRLRLGLPVLGSSILFAPQVAEYRRRYPGIDIELREHGSRHLEEQVRSGEIEMGATLYPVPQDFEWQQVIDEPLVALLPAGHALAGRRTVKFKELTASPFILFESGFVLNAVLARACRQRGVELEVAARGAHADFIIALVSAGLGVSVLPRLIIETRNNIGVSTPLIEDKDIRWRLGLIWRRSLSLSPAAEKWLALVREKQSPARSGRSGRNG